MHGDHMRYRGRRRPAPLPRRRLSLSLRLTLCLVLPLVAGAEEPGLIDRVGALFDGLESGLNYVGRKASDLLGPGVGLDEQETAAFTETREFNERYPVDPGAVVSVFNEFGQVRINTWDPFVVQVVAEIRVGAESNDIASEVARAIDINVAPANDRVAIRTLLPDTRGRLGKINLEVDYVITAPRDANIMCESYFSDTRLQDIGGAVAVLAHYGQVSLRNIGGKAEVQTRGQFPVEADGLRQGGVFDLNGAECVLSNVAGTLRVRNFQAPVEVRRLANDVDVDISNDSGSILLFLAEDAAPDLVATCLFGGISSDIELARSAQSHLVVARSPNVESPQRVSLRATFGDIFIKRAGAPSVPPAALVEDTIPVGEVITHAQAVEPEGALRIDAIRGNVRVEGVDEDLVRVTATKFVRVREQSMARAALEALEVRLEPDGAGGLEVRTVVTGDMAVLGRPAYRVDLAIRCPRTTPITLRAADGHTAVANTGAPIVVEQDAGSISVQHIKGPAKLTNRRGAIEAGHCADAVEASAQVGDIRLSQVFGAVAVECQQGKVVLEALRGEAAVSNQGGDVRVIALDGVEGNYDLQVRGGNLSVLLSEEASMAIEATAENGHVYSAIPLTGAIERGFESFRGRLNGGQHRVRLQAWEGDIHIN